MAFKSILKPLKIGPVEIKNRIAMAPMNLMHSAETNGIVNDRVLAHYAARAKGGVGLVIVEATMATALSASIPYLVNLKLFNPAHIHGMAQIADVCHPYGAKVFVQLLIGTGVQSHPTRHFEHYAASPVAWERLPGTRSKDLETLMKKFPKITKHRGPSQDPHGFIAREMTIEEIFSEQEAFANSARMAVVAGYDGVEIHAAHGYLLHNFLSPRLNRRTDLYGGSLENRMRFLVELTAKTVEAVKGMNEKCAVTVRASSDDHMPGGITLEEMKVVVKRLEDIGIDGFHLSSGSFEALHWLYPIKDGAMLGDAKTLKGVMDIPVITPAVHDPKKVEKALADGKTDMISIARQFIADPEWVNKVQKGKEKGIVRCIRCGRCHILLRSMLPHACYVNPNAGRELYMPEYWPPPLTRKSRDEIMPSYLVD